MKPELKIISLLEDGQPVVLITVIDKQGSGPRSPGAKIVIVEDGTFWGTIGGGQVENQAISFARQFFTEDAQAAVVHFQLKPGHEGENIDMLCGGRVSLLVEKITPDNETIALFRRFQALSTTPQKGVWAIDLNRIDSEQKVTRYLIEKGTPPSSVPTALLKWQKGLGTSRLVDLEEGSSWFVDSSIHSGHLFLIGGGHVALAVARLAQAADFAVTVCDNRAEFASRSRFPDIDDVVITPEFTRLFAQAPINSESYIVILTHGHDYDQTALEQALQTDAGYVGMIGSLRKRGAIYANLEKAGFTKEQLAEVHCPVGLEIGAESPFEIALSIVAELIQKRARSVSSR
ncbi:MAG: XdhC family protein [Desulfuromusa sp.]|nr:XdhC family protein [Desulfuromusa sp.]